MRKFNSTASKPIWRELNKQPLFSEQLNKQPLFSKQLNKQTLLSKQLLFNASYVDA